MTRAGVESTVPPLIGQRGPHWSMPDVPHLTVSHIPRAIDFYLALGCEVALVADGWVRLRQAEARFVLVRGYGDDGGRPGVLGLTSPDLDGLRRRLLALGIGSGPLLRSPDAPTGVIHVRDPDLHVVVITRAVLASASDRGSPSPRGLPTTIKGSVR